MNQCEKKSFRTLDQAQSRADEINKNNRKQRRKNSPLRAYECPGCGEFHLTHESLDEFKAKTQKSEKFYDPQVISERLKEIEEKIKKPKN